MGSSFWPLGLSYSTAVNHTAGLHGECKVSVLLGTESVPSVRPLDSQMRNTMSKLQDHETLNMGQMHLVMSVIYQESKPTAKIREKAPDLHSPAEQERGCISLPSRHHALTTFLPPRRHTGLLGSRTSLFRPQHHKHDANQQKGFGVHGSCHEVPPPPQPGSNNVISSPHGGLI